MCFVANRIGKHRDVPPIEYLDELDTEIDVYAYGPKSKVIIDVSTCMEIMTIFAHVEYYWRDHESTDKRYGNLVRLHGV